MEHGEITVEKRYTGVYEAKTTVTKPLKIEVSMKGTTAEKAKEKLELFLAGKPYKHI